MPAALKIETAATVEPVSLAEAKLHLRVDHTADDELITSLIKAARQAAETFLRRQLVTATWLLTMDGFPAAIRPPYPPLQSVSSIKYDDSDGNEQTLAAAAYRVDIQSEPGRITEASGYTWPSTFWQTGAVRVTYKCGYGDAATDVRDDIIAGIKLLLGHLYEHRELVVMGGSPQALPETVERLWWPSRVFSEL